MTTPTNLKPRLLWCQFCDADEMSDQPDPRCPRCEQHLITVVFSVLTGERITGRRRAYVALVVGNPTLMSNLVRR